MHLQDLQGTAPGGDVLFLRAFGTTDLALELSIYNKWMADERLRYETGTDEVMTADDIRDMQKQWLVAPDKFNYIIWFNNRVPIGDIGLFYKTVDGKVDYEEGEISMMIAVPSSRRKGLGRIAHDLVVSNARLELKTQKIVAKIKENNLPSIKFFGDKLQYKEVSRSSVFQEITFERDVVL